MALSGKLPAHAARVTEQVVPFAQESLVTITKALPPETALFRCVYVLDIPLFPKEQLPDLYFMRLEKLKTLRVLSGFRTSTLPLFNPMGKGAPGATRQISVWQMKHSLSFRTAFSHWPVTSGELPFCFLEALFAVEDDYSGPVLARDGRRVLARMGSPHQLHPVRFRYDLAGPRSNWIIGPEEDAGSSDICPPETLFLAGH